MEIENKELVYTIKVDMEVQEQREEFESLLYTLGQLHERVEKYPQGNWGYLVKCS